MNKPVIKIGDNYDFEKFKKGFSEAVLDLIAKVMPGANQKKVTAKQKEAEKNLALQIREVPVIYYRVIERFIDGQDFSDIAEFTDGNTFENFAKRGKCALIDIVSNSHSSLKIKDERAEIEYFESEANKRRQKSMGNLTSKQVRAIAKAQIKKQLSEYNANYKLAIGEIKGNNKAIKNLAKLAKTERKIIELKVLKEICGLTDKQNVKLEHLTREKIVEKAEIDHIEGKVSKAPIARERVVFSEKINSEKVVTTATKEPQKQKDVEVAD